MTRIFVDSDIAIDLLAERQPYYRSAAQLFSMADRKEIRILFSALSFTNIHYVLRKVYNSAEARKLLVRFKVLVNVLPVDNKTIELALSSDIRDFEDAVQYYTAIENKANVIVTRNLKDYKLSSISVLTAEEFLKAS